MKIIKHFGYILFVVPAFLFLILCLALFVIRVAIFSPEEVINFMTSIIQRMTIFLKIYKEG